MALRLFVVRHGETGWSRERRFAGSRDIPLTADGLRQSEAVARTLASLPVSAVYTSPLLRARATAGPIAAVHGLVPRIEPAFREMNFGDWEGLSRDEVAVRAAADYAVWQTAPERFRRPGGESLADVFARVRAGIEGLAEQHEGETVVLVTHAVVTRLIVLDGLGLGPERLWSVDASPAGITEVEYRPDWVTLHRVNTLAHLEALVP